MTLAEMGLGEIFQLLIVPAFFATLRMLVISGVLSTVFGFFLGIVLVITEKGGLCENAIINRLLDIVVNIIRSFPFIILMIAIIQGLYILREDEDEEIERLRKETAQRARERAQASGAGDR